ncbi:MAG: FHA domain-containing protein [Porticoccaceae bacterium]|nr:FHA domain-containing protein [Porticoccaceae bacterium]
MANKMAKLLSELKRRKVINTIVLYIVVSWVVLQVISIVFPIVGDEEQYFYVFLSLFILGFPIVVLISWFYQVTPRGFVRATPFVERRRLDNIAPHLDRRLSLKKRDNKGLLAGSGWFINAEMGPVEGLEYPINSTTVVGRAIECDITLQRSYISREQAKLALAEGGLTIEDMGSSNGTYVNGVAIEGEKTLQHGDEISFKDVIFRVREDRSEFKDEAMMNQTMVVSSTK